MRLVLPSLDAPDRLDRIAALRRQVAGLAPYLAVPSALIEGEPPWRLGLAPVAEDKEPALDPAGLHEIRPEAPGERGCAATAAALGPVFALLLTIRRVDGLRSGASVPVSSWPRGSAPVAWCIPAQVRSEIGLIHGPGLVRLGLDPARVLLVEARTRHQTLWAMEEGLKSGSLAAVVGLVGDADLNEARRLALAADAGRTPCLIVTAASSQGMAATASRWRVGPAPSAPHPFDAAAPGALRFTVTLERSRLKPPVPIGAASILEWCHDASRFRLAARLADRAPAPPGAATDGEEHWPRRVAGST